MEVSILRQVKTGSAKRGCQKGVLGILPPNIAKVFTGHVIRSLQRGITFLLPVNTLLLSPLDPPVFQNHLCSQTNRCLAS